MSRKQPTPRKKSAKAARRIRQVDSPYSRRSVFQSLEERFVLDGYFSTLATDIAGNGTGSVLSTITSSLEAINSITRLPIINKPISQISQLTDAFETFQTNLQTTLNALKPTDTQSFVISQLTQVLAESTTSSATPAVPVVTISPTSVDITLDLNFLDPQFSSAAGLGVPSVPFQPQTGTDGGFTVGLVVPSFISVSIRATVRISARMRERTSWG